jgi:hypothetical protein
MRFATILLAVLIGVMASPTAPPAAAEPPPIPDLGGYTAVAPDAFVSDGEVYFQTPDGLLCAIRPNVGAAGCDGRLPATLIGVNEIVLAADVNTRGLRATANPRFVKPSGGAAPVLHEGQKVTFADFECAVGRGAFTFCAKGSPATQWMVVSPGRTGIGPATAGLPPGFADPNDFAVGDDTYLVGSGAKNLFPVFTIDGGLTCSIVVYSGGEIGCDGPLPGVLGGENEVFAQLPGATGTRRSNDPKFSTPTYPGPIRQLPVGYRVNGIGSTCMAITGGVACYGTLAGHTQGFQVSPAGVSTYGG